MAARIDREELRMLIREALKEALGREAASAPPLRGRVAGPKHGVGEGSPETRPASSNHSPSRSAATPSPQGGGGSIAHFTSGVLNESKVAEIGRTHSRIVIGTDVAVTPLARDRAREIKVEIVRQKP